MIDEMRIHYEAVMRDLEGKRVELQQKVGDLQRQLKELHFTMVSITRLIDTPVNPAVHGGSARSGDAQKYSSYSVRWAILFSLSESSRPLSIQEISDTLLAGGIRTSASNFSNNVSAVLSQMKSKPKAEVAVVDGKWVITEVGKGAWNHIWSKQAKQTRFKRFSSFGTETPDVSASGATH